MIQVGNTFLEPPSTVLVQGSGPCLLFKLNFEAMEDLLISMLVIVGPGGGRDSVGVGIVGWVSRFVAIFDEDCTSGSHGTLDKVPHLILSSGESPVRFVP